VSVYTIYKTDTGRVVKIHIGVESGLANNVNADEGHYEGEFDAASTYFPDGEPVLRPDNPAQLDKTSIVADGVDVATLSGVPVGAVVTLSAVGVLERVTVDDGVLEITAELPGDYTVSIDTFPAKSKELSFVAT